MLNRPSSKWTVVERTNKARILGGEPQEKFLLITSFKLSEQTGNEHLIYLFCFLELFYDRANSGSKAMKELSKTMQDASSV